MKYINAADVLPEKLLIEVLKYVNGELLYIPIMRNKHRWGENSGSRIYYQERNQKIKPEFPGKSGSTLTGGPTATP